MRTETRVTPFWRTVVIVLTVLGVLLAMNQVFFWNVGGLSLLTNSYLYLILAVFLPVVFIVNPLRRIPLAQQVEAQQEHGSGGSTAPVRERRVQWFDVLLMVVASLSSILSGILLVSDWKHVMAEETATATTADDAVLVPWVVGFVVGLSVAVTLSYLVLAWRVHLGGNLARLLAMAFSSTSIATLTATSDSTSATAAVSTMPWIAATGLRQYRGGRGRRSHGTIRPAAQKAYRARPMASTAGPTVPATYTLRTRIRNASTSMSKRAPSGVTVPVRRATRPSTPSRTRPTAASHASVLP